MADTSNVKIVTVEELREMFNREAFWDRVQRGELVASLLVESHPSPPLAPEPYCTRSQIIDYFTPEGQKVAKVHQYLRPDGTIGASGRPDPKYLILDGIRYRAKRS